MARLFIGGHVFDSSVQEVYSSTMKSVSPIILMTITSRNNLEVMTSDIGNEYLNSNIQENMYTRAGANFELVGIIDEETLLKVIKALYGLPTIGNSWRAHLLHTLRGVVLD